LSWNECVLLGSPFLVLVMILTYSSEAADARLIEGREAGRGAEEVVDFDWEGGALAGMEIVTSIISSSSKSFCCKVFSASMGSPSRMNLTFAEEVICGSTRCR